MQIKDKIKDAFGKNRQQRLTALALLIIVNVLLTAGVFAYFHSSDFVTNRITAEQTPPEQPLPDERTSVILKEPQWYEKGMEKASAFEPGMTIEKNPYAYNDGESDIYVRIKMTISVEASQNVNLSDENVNNPEIKKLSQTEVRDKILKSLMLSDGKTPLVASVDAGGNIEINHSLFSSKTAVPCDYAVEKDSNDNFTYYFYFVKQAQPAIDTNEMIVLHPNESSAELFNYVDIPIYKKDYLGVFDQEYQITLIAEAVPVKSCNENTVAEYKRVFAN